MCVHVSMCACVCLGGIYTDNAAETTEMDSPARRQKREC